MRENNFEKQVREKMEQLQFDPADAVWLNVDKEINKEKRRRPLFWLIFPLGILLLTGGGYYFIADKNHSHGITKAQMQNVVDQNQQKLSAGNDEIAVGGVKVKNRTGGRPEDELDKPGKEENKIRHGIKTASAEMKRQSMAKTPANNSKEVISEINENRTNKNEAGPVAMKSDSATSKVSLSDSKNKSVSKDSVSAMKMAKTTDKKKKSFPWQIGFSGSAGISNMNESLFKPVSATNYAYSAATPGYGLSNSPGAASTHAPSNINPGFSFGLAVFANRHLSERFSLSAGVGYHYYSTEIQTGHFIDSTSSFNFPSIQASSVNAYYSTGKIQTYTNQYHFIELPVSVDFQITKSKKTALILEGGFTLSYLLSSNALQFDPNSNVYFKSDQLFNRTQLSAATAFLIGLPVRYASLQIGPQLQYGLTNVLKSSSGSTEHLIYYGLKISFIPGKL